MTDIDEPSPEPGSSYSDADVEEMMAELRSEYAERLPELVGDLRVALDLLRVERAAPEAIRASRLLAHRLFGTAGSYGFDTISMAAERIEATLLEWESQGRPRERTAWKSIDDALDILIADAAATTSKHR